MRASTVLFVTCLLAASTGVSLQQALPAVTPSARLERRVAVGNRHLHERAPLGPGLFTSEDSAAGTGTGSTTSVSTSTTPTSTSTSSTSSTSTSSTRTTSSTTSTTPTTAASSTTNSAGSVVMVTQTVALTSSSATAAAQTSAAKSDNDSGGGHLGLIIGVSVVGGIAILGALIFLYMKFGGRRFSDYEHDDSDIKWPELKADENAAAMQPLPARRTGGAGFDMGDDSDNGHEGLMMGGVGTVAGDTHSMNDYGGKAHDSMLASSTALHSTGTNGGAYAGAGGYGGQMDTVYDEEDMGNGHYDAAGVTGYYDAYNTNGNGGYATHNQQQMFYPDQVSGGGHDYGAGGYGSYGGQHDPYGGGGGNTSPPSNAYRMAGGHNGGY